MTGIDVQIVAYGAGRLLARALESIDFADGRTIVVDHLGDVDASNTPPGVLVLRDEANPGFGAGHNHALAEGSSPWVLLLNPDAAVVSEGAVRQGVRFLEEHDDAALVQGVIVDDATGEPERSAGVELGPVHLLGRALGLRRLQSVPAVRALAARSHVLRDHIDRTPTSPVTVEALAATAMLARRAALEEVGGFDSRYFLYGEDLDLARRLRRAGWRSYALPDLWARHVSGGTSATAWDRELHWWEGTLRFAANWWDARAWAVAMVAAVTAAARLMAQRPRAAGRVAHALLAEPWRVRRSPASAPGRPSTTPWSRRRP